MKKKILYLFSLTMFFSCSDRNSTIDEVSLEGQIVKMEENEGKMPFWMYRDRIYARDTAYNICSGKLTKTEWQKSEKVFISGRGHNEFGLIALSQDKDGALYVLDRPWEGSMLTSLTKIQHTDSIDIVKDQTKWEKYSLLQLPPFVQNADNFEIISDSTILVPGAPANNLHHILSIINFKKQTITPLDYWPDDGTPDNKVEEKFIIYTSGSDIQGDGKGRFLYWDNSGRVAFIFTIDGPQMNILSHLYSDPLPIPSSGKMPLTERIYCCSNNNRIYLLYLDSDSKGEKKEKYNPKDPFPMGNTIEIYDWNGIKQQVIHLDKYGKMIMLSEDSKTLYLFSGYMNDGEEYIYSYDLTVIK